jgi:hypothetical protein
MFTSQVVSDMCHKALSQADIKAICKNRGFSPQEATSRALFENFLLSDIGVAEALQKLTQREISLLYLLKLKQKAVDISFFQPLYDSQPGRSWRYSTFTQRHQKTFKQVKLALVRRGILLMAEDTGAINANTKMERWRFRFPQEFEQFLPSPFKNTMTFDAPGQFNESLVRDKLLEIVGQSSSASRLKGGQYRLHLVKGQLRLGDKRFLVSRLQDWQKAEWAFAIREPKTKYTVPKTHALPLLEGIAYAMSLLKPQEWITPPELLVLLKVFTLWTPESKTDVKLDAGKICQVGWQWGRLIKHVADNQVYYRLPDNNLLAGTDLDPGRYLHLTQAQTLGVNLQLIPYQSLEYLSRVADMKVVDRQLEASPNLVKMGRVMASVQSHPLTAWLPENAPAFAKAIKTINRRWGKQIVHQDLLIAKIKDLSLKVTLQKTITAPGQIIFLPQDFIAFPRRQLKTIKKLVNKSGHVIKWIQAE